MAEIFVPKILDRLADAALQQLEERVNLIVNVEKEVGNISRTFKTLEKSLRDAERRKLKDDAVRAWVEELEDIAYEMEDVLEEWHLKINVVKVKPAEAENHSILVLLLEKVRSFIFSLCSCVKKVPVRNDIALKIKEINDRLEFILREADRFKFVMTSTVSGDFVEFKRPMSTIFDESEVLGRDSDKDSLLKLLLPEVSLLPELKDNGVKVISIVGSGGSGKTTLAQFLYNDQTVQDSFPLKKWVCVSDPFDEIRIAKALIETKENSNAISLLELESLLQFVKDVFSGKRFFLVLDDVWTEENSKWQLFRNSLKDGASGSIILVTTRSEKVARVVGTDHAHNLDLLSDSNCWSIIKNIALSKRPELCETVKEIGVKIAEKCKGLPLAAKTLGGLLQFKDTPQEWKQVLESEIWEMEEAAVELFPHFYLSYKELTPQLKRCFSYCAVFPKDTQIEVKKLIRLWMAQGYLSGRPSERGGDDNMEKKGYECFKTLAMRSFFQELQPSKLDGNVIVYCKMHDIVHDFAQFLVKSECRVFEEVDCQKVETNYNQGGGRGCSVSKEGSRHVTIKLGKTNPTSSSIMLDSSGKLRSLFLSCDGELPKDLCRKLKSVRSLTLKRCGLQELPREIGNLIHMRYLDVSYNEFKELPETICNLHYLEALNLAWCMNLEYLPERIGELVHLRYLNCSESVSLKEMPSGIEKLTWLRELYNFIPNSASNTIAKLECLEELSMNFRDYDGSPMEMLLELPTNLVCLGIENYPATQLPKPLDNLKVLWLENAPLITSLPGFGKLSFLVVLYLHNLPKLKHIGHEFYGVGVAFTNLKMLGFDDLMNWETWEDTSEEQVMPRLEELRILWCPKLEALPLQILGKASSLKTLGISRCDKLKEKYSEETGGEEWTRIISQVSEVYLDWRVRGGRR